MIFPHNGTRKPSNLSACDDCIKETSSASVGIRNATSAVV